MWTSTIGNISLAITLVATALMFLIALGQLMIRPLNAGRIIGALLFFWFCLFLLNAGLGRRWTLEHLPYIYSTHVPFYFLASPLLKAYMRGLMSPRLIGATYEDLRTTLSFPSAGRLWPFFLALGLYLPFYFLPVQVKMAMLVARSGNDCLAWYHHVLVVAGSVGLLSAGYALLKLFFELKAYDLFRRADRVATLWHMRVILLWLALMAPLGLISVITGELVIRRISVGMVSLGILWLYLLDFRYPGLFHQIDHEFRIQQKTERYRKSKIQHLDVAKTLSQLEDTMVRERMYADEQLTIQKLADILEIRTDQLSELLNNVLGIDFRRYITEFRVAAARQMLQEQPERSILAIAYNVGFNSKSAFNRNFKAIVGQTPAEFRESRLSTPLPREIKSDSDPD